METEKKYTVKNAVADVLAIYGKGTDFGGIQLCNDCQAMLNTHNAGKYPMQTTIMRELRKYKNLNNVILKDHYRSVYHIMSDEEMYLHEAIKSENPCSTSKQGFSS